MKMKTDTDLKSIENKVRDAIIDNIEINIADMVRGPEIIIAIVKERQNMVFELKQVESYDFNYQRQRGYVYIERIKILGSSSGFYLSFDPADETRLRNPRDQNVVIAHDMNFIEKLNEK